MSQRIEKKPVLLTKSFTIFRTKLSSALYFFADKSTFSLSSSPFKDYCNHQSVLNFVCVSAFRFTPRSLSRSVSPVYVWLLLMLVASIKWKSHSKRSTSLFRLVHLLGFQSILPLGKWWLNLSVNKKNQGIKCVEFDTLLVTVHVDGWWR